MVIRTVRSSQLAGMSSVREDAVICAAAAAARTRSSLRTARDSGVICLPLTGRGATEDQLGRTLRGARSVDIARPFPDRMGRPLGHRAEHRSGSVDRATGYTNAGLVSPTLGQPPLRPADAGVAHQLSETLGATSWSELGLVFESDATAGFVPVVHPAFPPAVSPSLPFQQESVHPYPARQNLAWLGVRGDVLRETVEALAEQGGHRL
jgi:hypothetical protein